MATRALVTSAATSLEWRARIGASGPDTRLRHLSRRPPQGTLVDAVATALSIPQEAAGNRMEGLARRQGGWGQLAHHVKGGRDAETVSAALSPERRGSGCHHDPHGGFGRLRFGGRERLHGHQPRVRRARTRGPRRPGSRQRVGIDVLADLALVGRRQRNRRVDALPSRRDEGAADGPGTKRPDRRGLQHRAQLRRLERDGLRARLVHLRDRGGQDPGLEPERFAQPGAFVDPAIPAGYAPFGIQRLGATIVVSYAKQDAARKDDVAGQGHGFVDLFDTSGTFLRRVATRGQLNSPWGVAMAPASFGAFGGDLLVGNFGDGQISAFAPQSDGTFELVGQLRTSDHKPVTIDGLWSLQFGKGAANNGPPTTLFFTAGPNDESHGLFGTITAG